jgi:hypothetical protein
MLDRYMLNADFVRTFCQIFHSILNMNIAEGELPFCRLQLLHFAGKFLKLLVFFSIKSPEISQFS